MDKDRTEAHDKEETAIIDDVEDRVQAEMKEIEGRAKERAGQGMRDKELENEGRELKEEGKQELEQERRNQ